ncbi:hypothetical protein [Brenneria tiliae]|uniref:hypothetical protein n=1 Tax=Brenneria tiliae TaxID=2914984 RepID=UPI002014A921|nr:hypothetical protein [Brenneria tiliae]MCL2899390.1 hypothetical protein [Brenneria tiliae]MCL2903768.1 hypothetical protein [Brenneria tiliae]
MLHSQVKAKNQRSFQTIRDNTSVINSFESRSFPDTVEVRRMLSRTHKESQHFIVTLKSDLDRAADTTVVKPFAEIAIRGEKLRFTVKPKNQYPNLHVSEEILRMIETSVARFMENTFATHVFFSDNKTQDSKKEWCLL